MKHVGTHSIVVGKEEFSLAPLRLLEQLEVGDMVAVSVNNIDKENFTATRFNVGVVEERNAKNEWIGHWKKSTANNDDRHVSFSTTDFTDNFTLSKNLFRNESIGLHTWRVVSVRSI